MKLTLMLLLSMLLHSCTKCDYAAYCDVEFQHLANKYSSCSLDRSVDPLCSNIDGTKEDSMSCPIYSSSDKNNHKLCLQNIEQMSCEKIADINYLEDVEGCLAFNKKDKVEACVYNYEKYCKSVYVECGDDKLPSICTDVNYDERRFDRDKIRSYCKNVQYAGEKMTGVRDLICELELDCQNLPDIDFKSENWKSLCE